MLVHILILNGQFILYWLNLCFCELFMNCLRSDNPSMFCLAAQKCESPAVRPSSSHVRIIFKEISWCLLILGHDSCPTLFQTPFNPLPPAEGKSVSINTLVFSRSVWVLLIDLDASQGERWPWRFPCSDRYWDIPLTRTTFVLTYISRLSATKKKSTHIPYVPVTEGLTSQCLFWNF